MRMVGYHQKRRHRPLLGSVAALLVCVLLASVVQGKPQNGPVVLPTVTPTPPVADVSFPTVESDAPYSKAESLPEEEETVSAAEEGAPVVERTMHGGQAVAAFFVQDSTGAGLDLEEELQQDPEISVQTGGEPMVLIYHTHTTECFLPAFTGYITEADPVRTLDETKNMVAVGERIAEVLTARGIGVVHDKTVHDHPAYTGAYDRSWETIQKNLERYPSIVMTIDVHRDAMVAEDGTAYKPTAEVGGQKAAQIMIITGRDPDGSYGFPNWRKNLHMALQLQQCASEKYGDLMRPLNFCDRRYNMNATVNSLLVEVGTHVNTLGEALYSATLFGDALSDVLLRYAAD